MIPLKSCFVCINLSSFAFEKCSHFCIDFYGDLLFSEIRTTADSVDLYFQIGTPFHLQINSYAYYLHSYLKFQMIYYCQHWCLFSSVDFILHWICYFLMISPGTLCLASEFREKYSFIKLAENYFRLIKMVINNSTNLLNLSVWFNSFCSANNCLAADYLNGFFQI